MPFYQKSLGIIKGTTKTAGTLDKLFKLKFNREGKLIFMIKLLLGVVLHDFFVMDESW